MSLSGEGGLVFYILSLEPPSQERETQTQLGLVKERKMSPKLCWVFFLFMPLFTIGGFPFLFVPIVKGMKGRSTGEETHQPFPWRLMVRFLLYHMLVPMVNELSRERNQPVGRNRMSLHLLTHLHDPCLFGKCPEISISEITLSRIPINTVCEGVSPLLSSSSRPYRWLFSLY